MVAFAFTVYLLCLIVSARAFISSDKIQIIASALIASAAFTIYSQLWDKSAILQDLKQYYQIYTNIRSGEISHIMGQKFLTTHLFEVLPGFSENDLAAFMALTGSGLTLYAIASIRKSIYIPVSNMAIILQCVLFDRLTIDLLLSTYSSSIASLLCFLSLSTLMARNLKLCFTYSFLAFAEHSLAAAGNFLIYLVAFSHGRHGRLLISTILFIAVGWLAQYKDYLLPWLPIIAYNANETERIMDMNQVLSMSYWLQLIISFWPLAAVAFRIFRVKSCRSKQCLWLASMLPVALVIFLPQLFILKRYLFTALLATPCLLGRRMLIFYWLIKQLAFIAFSSGKIALA